jgi:Flp pilus assembly protein TadG
MAPTKQQSRASNHGLCGAAPSNRRSGSLAAILVRARRSEQGQSVVEFAMVLVPMAFVALVLILFGKVIYAYIQVTHAANEGARLAAVNQPQASSLTSVLTSSYALPGGTTVAICYPSSGSRAIGQPVEVDVYANATWVPIINIGQIKAAATMRIEQDTGTNTNLAATTTFNSTTKKCDT